MDYTESVEKIDDFTILVTFNTVFPAYDLQFGGEDVFIYPEHYCDAEAGFYEWNCDDQPLSSGPYILEEWVADDHLTFVRNPNYYEEGKPYIDQVIVQIVPEEPVKQAMMLEGDGDLHYWPAEPASNVYKEPGNGTEWVKSPTERWVMRLIPNLYVKGDRETPHPFLSDVRVRRALRMAIDVDTIINDIFLGYGEPVWNDFFRPPFNGCDIPRPEYDLEGAAALLEEAGWIDTDGDGIRECRGCETAEEGTPMTMEFAIYAEYGETLELTQQLIAEAWKSIGVDTDLQIIEGAIMWAEEEDGGTEIAGKFELDMWELKSPGNLSLICGMTAILAPIQPTRSGPSTTPRVIGITVGGLTKIWTPGSMNSIRWTKSTGWKSPVKWQLFLKMNCRRYCFSLRWKCMAFLNGFKVFCPQPMTL
jgi:peptide/nickel transport system substrate-binding protein